MENTLNAYAAFDQDAVDLRGVVERMTRRPASRNTNTAYRKAFKRLCVFCLLHGLDPEHVSPDELARFLCSLYENGRSLPSLRSAAAGIKFRYEQNGLWTARHGLIARNIIINAKREMAKNGRMLPAQAAPFREQEFRLVSRACRQGAEAARTAWRRRDILLDLALVSVMLDTLARRSEVSAFNWGDLELHEDGDATILIRQSKTDQGGVGRMAYVSARSLYHLEEAGGIRREGPMFVSRKHCRMDDRTVCRRLKRAVERAGIDPARFSGHSCRVGMAMDLKEAGFSLIDLQQVGGWSSPSMPYYYVRRTDARTNAVARFRRQQAAHDRYRAKVYPGHFSP